MRNATWLALLTLLGTAAPSARAHPSIPRPFQLDRINRALHGQLVDYTRNHGADRRFWSPALGEKRDLYVYLPPDYDPGKQYPLIIVLHGFSQDEKVFFDSIVRPIDRAIAAGDLPPAILAAPDGSPRGVSGLFSAGTFFLNTRAGNFEDYLVEDVWNFLTAHYPIRPEREAHVMLGVSMGGGAAFNKAIKYKERFGVAVGIFPPLNSRWMSCRGRYMDNFDPNCWGWRTDFNRRREVVGRFYGFYTVRLRRIINPLYGRDTPDVLQAVMRENPIEMLALYDVQPGDVEMYIAYGGRDEFNIDAQIESFLFVARQRGLDVGVGYDPRGRHNEATALKLFPGLLAWLKPRLAPYSPD